MQSRIMKNKFLLTTAVLLGSVSFAAAQGIGGAAGGGDQGMHQGMSSGASATHHEGATSPGSRAGSRTVGEGHAGSRDQGPSARHGASHETTGEGQAHHGMEPHQAEQNRHSEKAREKTTGAATHEHGQAEQHQAQKPGQSEMSKHGRHTTGMAHERGEQTQQRSEQHQRNAERGQQHQHNAERQKHNTGQERNAERQGNAQQQQNNKASTAQRENTRHQGTVGAARQGQSGMAETQTGAAESQSGHTRLSAQQQTHIRQTVLSESSVPRVQANDIHFQVHRGVEVPSHVSVVSVSRYPALIDAFPYYRDDSFFVTEDEIIFVSPDHRVVNVVPVGPRAPFAREGGSYGYTAVNLPPDQIREVQEVLIQRGFLHGEADGVFGPQTRSALIAFQRKEGIQATGSISTRTVAALGLSNRIETQGQSSTVGEGHDRAQQSNRMGEGHGRMNNENGPEHNRATTGEANGPRGTEAPSSEHHPRAGQNTTGEATPHNKSTTGESGNQPANDHSMQKPGGDQGMQNGAKGTTGEGNGQAAPGQSSAQSPGQGSATSSQGAGQQGSGSTHHNR